MIFAPCARLLRATATHAKRRHRQSAITHLIAAVPVSDLEASIDWYSRFFGRPPDLRAGEEILWDVDEHATLFIEPDAPRAGSGRVTAPPATRSASASRRPDAAAPGAYPAAARSSTPQR